MSTESGAERLAIYYQHMADEIGKGAISQESMTSMQTVLPWFDQFSWLGGFTISFAVAVVIIVAAVSYLEKLRSKPPGYWAYLSSTAFCAGLAIECIVVGNVGGIVSLVMAIYTGTCFMHRYVNVNKESLE